MPRLTDPIDLTKSESDNKRLHRHQQEALNNMDEYFDLSLKTDEEQNGLLVMPTGSGKTFTAVSWLLDRAVSQGFKVLWLVHRQELVGQADTTFRGQASILSGYGIKKLRIIPISGGHYTISQASRYDVNVCGIGSVASKNGMRYIRRMLGVNGQEKLVIVIDEAHHAVSPSYQKVLKRINSLNPKRLLIGLTATPTRMQDSEREKLQRMFNVTKNIKSRKGTNNGYIYEVSLKDLLLAGFLAQPVYKRIETNIVGDVEYELSTEDDAFFDKFGELSERIKEQIAQSSGRNRLIVEEYLNNREKYGKTLVFAVNRLHCLTLHKAFTDAGVSCRYCMSGEPGTSETIRDFKENKFDVLINVQILTEGSDVPDIQSIFLTRQTNSDSLLMQMIGRGLRGPDAGGTKYAYIVDFHDTWDRFSFWLDPQQLISNEYGEMPESDEDRKTQATKEESALIPWDVYLKMYNTMKSNSTRVSHKEVFPNGWYSVTDNDGQDVRVLVYDNQVDGYNLIAQNVESIKKLRYDTKYALKNYFDINENLPTVKDLQLVLNDLAEDDEMPLYYTFTQRDEVDPHKIASKLVELDMRRSEEEEWLSNLYNSHPVLQELYKLLPTFKANVNSCIHSGEQMEPQIDSIDEREDFNIVPDYYDLKDIEKELIDTWFHNDNVPEIRWSNRPLRSRYGLCTKFEDGSFVIAVNKLLSSPNVPIEVVKYIIYHELLHANGFWHHDGNFRAEEWKYPNSDELDGLLDELFLRYKIDEIVPPRNRTIAETLTAL